MTEQTKFQKNFLNYFFLDIKNFKRVGSYIDFPDWIKNKKARISPINKKDKCFQYAIAVTFNHEEIEKHPKRITKN